MSELLKIYLAHKLTEKKPISDPEKLNNSIRSANIDLNPHQVDAAIFAFKSPLSRGAILADEVGLGKTIEAGLIVDQLFTEGRKNILVLVPASLRTQWQDELLNRFHLPSVILDGSILKKMQKELMKANPLEEGGIFIASHNFAYRYDYICKNISWNLVVIDEAHRLRNVWKKGNKTAKKIREVIKGRPKVLLTATPLQNNLMELYGLTSFLDENYLGTEFSFKTLFANPVKKRNETERLKQLRERLMGTIDQDTGTTNGGILTRALRKQVQSAGLVSFTNRHSITEDFAPNDDEIELYNSVSEYLHRPFLASTKATQRNMMELVYRKILASSSFAIAGTLHKVAHFLARRLQVEFNVSCEEVNQVAESLRSNLAREHQKNLEKIIFPQNEKKLTEEEQLVLPGLEDIETTLEKLEEEKQDTDDLGEDEPLSEENKKPEEREIDHKFTKVEVLQEFQDVLQYYFLATTIDKNQKSQALVRALNKVFKHADKQKWPQKAVIFTESRRTQDHLEKLLGGIGYDLVLFNGSNAGKRAKEIFEEWKMQFPQEAEQGSKSINLRKALVWKFRSIEKGILITTEAGAEGLNLQFTNIVINYDLPWNPQRIEQRIGRCHRYGQALDVLVVNFLNKSNYADQRVYELLSEKIKLFGNLFDFSDKVLGTEQLTDDGYEVREIALGGLGTGLDFEKKILNIYRKCRTEKQIENSFKQLQLELSFIIQEKIEDAQRKVIQHFDAEVRQKLRVRQNELKESLKGFDSRLKRYLDISFPEVIHYQKENIFEYNGTIYYLGQLSEEDKNKGYKSAHIKEQFIRERLEGDKKIHGHIWEITFRHDEHKGRRSFDDLVGRECQLVVDMLKCKQRTINGAPEEFEKIVIAGLMKDGDRWIPITNLNLDRLFDLIITNEKTSEARLRDELEDVAVKLLEATKEEINTGNESYIYEEMDHLNQFVEESLLKGKQEMETREKEIKDLQKTMRASRTLGSHERDQIQEQIDKKQKEFFRAQKRYFQAQEEQFIDKDKKVTELRSKLQMNFEHERIASVRFTITA